MALLTTTIGAYPKPDYVPTPDWFREGGAGLSNPTEAYQKYLASLPDNIEEILDRGTQEVVNDQVHVGVDIPTDGEVRRENYIHYHCRHIDGIDFSNLTQKVSRQGRGWPTCQPSPARSKPATIFCPATTASLRPPPTVRSKSLCPAL